MATEPTDEELMRAYQLGSEQSFERLYLRHSGRVYGYLKNRLRDQVTTSIKSSAISMKRLVSFLSLFTSISTLLCCALPALFVLLGFLEQPSPA